MSDTMSETRQSVSARSIERAPTEDREPIRAPAVQIDGMDAWYGDRHAIKGLSLSFAPNKATALIGPSGSGKSTVVRCINRMHEEQAGGRATGRVLLDGQDVYGDGGGVGAGAPGNGGGVPKPQPVPP